MNISRVKRNTKCLFCYVSKKLTRNTDDLTKQVLYVPFLVNMMPFDDAPLCSFSVLNRKYYILVESDSHVRVSVAI